MSGRARNDSRSARSRGAKTAATLLVWLLALAGGGAAAAQGQPPALGEDAELGDYLAYAAFGNPRLEAALQRWRAAVERIEQVETLPDPQLAYGYFIESPETRIGPQRQKLGVAQTVPWLSKLRLRGAVAAEAANAAERRYQAVKLALFFEVADTFYELYYLGRSIAITEDNLALLTHLESVAQANFKAGAPMSGVVKAQVEIGVLDDRLRTLRDLRSPLTARLNATLNRPVDTPVAWPREAPNRSVELTDEELQQWMQSDNPELQRLDFEIARDELAVELAHQEFRPNFMVGLDWIGVGQAVDPDLPGSGDDSWLAKVAVTVPLWRSKYRAGVEESSRRHDASLSRREDAENTLAADLELALFGFRDAERKIHLFLHTLVPLAEASLEVAQEAYTTGKEDFLSLIDAQRLLLEFQLNYERSLADREQRLAELEKLVGRPLGDRQQVTSQREDQTTDHGEGVDHE